jgi:orotate phosphoribosyltransferase
VDFSRDFIDLACRKGVLRFGAFVTKAGRNSPYFFNAGLFDNGASFRALCGYYARTIRATGVACDMLFGPAYKGIPLVAGTAIRLAEDGVDLPFAFNRKEAKDHGEGGTLVGAPLQGRVVIVDDVITAGTSVRESVAAIRAHGAVPAGVLIALDRMERGQGERSAVREVQDAYGIPVVAIATLDDVMTFITGQDDLRRHAPAVAAYRAEYGA